MSIINKKINDDIPAITLGVTASVLFLSFLSWMIVPEKTGIMLAEDVSSEINYFVSGDKINLEKQKIENKQSDLFNRSIKVSYPDAKTINMSYSTDKLNSNDIRITTRTLYRLDDNVNSKIKEINLDGSNIPVNTFELSQNNQEKIIDNIAKTEDLSKDHILTIKLK